MNAVCEPHVAYDLYENRLVEQQEQRFGERYEDARCELCLFWIELTYEQSDEIRLAGEVDKECVCDWHGECGICVFSSMFLEFKHDNEEPCEAFRWRTLEK